MWYYLRGFVANIGNFKKIYFAQIYQKRVSSGKFGYGSGRVIGLPKIFGSGTGRVICLFTPGRVKFGSGNYPQHPYSWFFKSVLFPKMNQLLQFLQPSKQKYMWFTLLWIQKEIHQLSTVYISENRKMFGKTPQTSWVGNGLQIKWWYEETFIIKEQI